jgi:predicted nucleic acid-binding Zn ribbon protein
MFCTACGKELQPEQKFCSNCGSQATSEDSTNDQNEINSSLNPSSSTKKNSSVSTWVTLAIAGLVVFVFLSAAFSSGSEEDDSSGLFEENSSPSQSSKSAEIRSNSVRTEEGLSVRLYRIDEDTPEPDSFFIDEPKGKLVVATLNISNDGNETYTINSLDFKGLSQGAEYDVSGILDSSGEYVSLDDINPGLSESLEIYFDLPQTRDLEGVLFQPNLFSDEYELFID